MHDPQTATTPVLTRRGLLAAAGGLWLASTFPRTGAAGAQARLPHARGVGFPSGVVAADPHLRGATLWTRIEGIDRSARLQVELSPDRDFRRVVYRQDVVADLERDLTVHHRVDHPAIRPGEPWFYRFVTCDQEGPVGRFRTRLPADSAEPVRIGWFSCQRYEHGFFTPHAALAADEDLDLVVSLGDYLYEEDSGPAPRTDGTGGPNGHAERLEQWRAKYRLYRSDPSLQAMHAAHAFVPVWDDCEVEGNWAGEGPSSGPSPVGPRSIPFAAKRANAFRAFFENMPTDVQAAPPPRLYRALRLGRNAELFMLDTRQHRAPQPCADASLQPCPDGELTDRVRLGAEQQRWLEASLAASQATWKVLGNAQMMMALDVGPQGTVPAAVDGWDGYGVERKEVLEFVRARGIEGLVSIVGDVHCYFAGTLYTAGRAPGTPYSVGSTPVGTEFVGTSISHDPLNLTGEEQSSAALANRVMLANPHLVYAQFRYRGYAVLEARPDELRVDFRAVRTVDAPQSESFLARSFTVARGSTVPVPTGGEAPV
jgi:alkaline phosphatase D